MNNTTITNNFNSNNSNIVYIKTQHDQIVTTIPNRIVKFKPMIKKTGKIEQREWKKIFDG